MVDVGADLVKPGPRGNQAVHVAAVHGHMGFLQMCVARGADLDAVNQGKLCFEKSTLFFLVNRSDWLGARLEAWLSFGTG